MDNLWIIGHWFTVDKGSVHACGRGGTPEGARFRGRRNRPKRREWKGRAWTKNDKDTSNFTIRLCAASIFLQIYHSKKGTLGAAAASSPEKAKWEAPV